VSARWALANAYVAAGESERGLAMLLDCVEQVARAHAVDACELYDDIVVGAMACGNADLARVYQERVQQHASELDLPWAQIVSSRALARVETGLRGEPSRAIVAAETAAGIAASIGMDRECRLAELLRAKALAQGGDRLAAVRSLRELETQFDDMGARRERDSARAELRRLRARIEPRGPSGKGDGLAALTGREREIAELITDRHTNKMIAGQLFLSQKTVESHVRNIFIKLGVSRRREIAVMVEQSRGVVAVAA
jgi:DNA-binding NarL/FixJ family response regulator